MTTQQFDIWHIYNSDKNDLTLQNVCQPLLHYSCCYHKLYKSFEKGIPHGLFLDFWIIAVWFPGANNYLFKEKQMLP